MVTNYRLWLLGVLASTASVSGNPNKFVGIKPGGATVCSDGSEFAFFHRVGTVNKLVIEFEGGGACWNDFTCDLGTFTPRVPFSEKEHDLNSKSSGIHDGNNAKNPTKEWHHIFIPYCTADVHIGNKTRKMGSKTVHFRGRVNAQTAVEWAFSAVPKPDVLLTMGCSAGSLGSMIWSAHIMKKWPASVRHVYWGDSYVGVVAKDQWEEGAAAWDLIPFVAPWIPAISSYNLTEWRPEIMEYILSATAEYYPQSFFSQYTSDGDSVQTSFFSLGGGDGQKWTDIMRNITAYSYDRQNRYALFIASGSHHCRSQDDLFFNVASDKVNLAVWLGDILDGQTEAPSFHRRVDCHDDAEPSCKDSEMFASAASNNSSDLFSERQAVQHMVVQRANNALLP